MRAKSDVSAAVAAVLDGLSINAAAAQFGTNTATIRRHLAAHPDYAKAKATGLIRPRGLPGVAPMDVEAMKQDPAVLEVVRDGQAIEPTAIKYGLSATALRHRVRKCYPDYVSPHAYGPRKVQAAAEAAPARAADPVFDAVIDPLVGAVLLASARHGLTPARVLEEITARLPTPTLTP